MTRRLLIVAASGLLLALTPAGAVEKGQWELGLGPDIHFYDNGMGTDNAVGGRIRLGWAFGDKLGAELAVQHTSSEDDFGDLFDADVTSQTASLNLVWAIGAQDFQPFLLFGLGWADLELESTESRPCNPNNNLGCLPKDFGSINLGQQADGARVDTIDDSGFLWQAGIGARFPIGRRFGFRVQAVAARVDLFDEAFTNLSAGVDISILWGQPK